MKTELSWLRIMPDTPSLTYEERSEIGDVVRQRAARTWRVWVATALLLAAFGPPLFILVTRVRARTDLQLSAWVIVAGITWWASLLMGIWAILLPAWRRECRILLAERAICPACGYDLTGNVSGTCSECGTETVPPAPRAMVVTSIHGRTRWKDSELARVHRRLPAAPSPGRRTPSSGRRTPSPGRRTPSP